MKYRKQKYEFNDKRKNQHKNIRNNLFQHKGNFKTPVTEIPCDTTEYELSPTPETGVMNWYQCVEKWRLEWLVEDIQNLLDCNGKTNVQQKEDRTKANVLIQELKQRLRKEKVTSEKQKNAADKFFHALGRGLPWGIKPYFTHDSVDARLFGCACCGMKEYDNGDSPITKKKFQLLPVDMLDLLKLSKEDCHKYRENLKVK
jgi:hypothetical protein